MLHFYNIYKKNVNFNIVIINSFKAIKTKKYGGIYNYLT